MQLSRQLFWSALSGKYRKLWVHLFLLSLPQKAAFLLWYRSANGEKNTYSSFCRQQVQSTQIEILIKTLLKKSITLTANWSCNVITFFQNSFFCADKIRSAGGHRLQGFTEDSSMTSCVLSRGTLGWKQSKGYPRDEGSQMDKWKAACCFNG